MPRPKNPNGLLLVQPTWSEARGAGVRSARDFVYRVLKLITFEIHLLMRCTLPIGIASRESETQRATPREVIGSYAHASTIAVMVHSYMHLCRVSPSNAGCRAACVHETNGADNDQVTPRPLRQGPTWDLWTGHFLSARLRSAIASRLDQSRQRQRRWPPSVLSLGIRSFSRGWCPCLGLSLRAEQHGCSSSAERCPEPRVKAAGSRMASCGTAQTPLPTGCGHVDHQVDPVRQRHRVLPEPTEPSDEPRQRHP